METKSCLDNVDSAIHVFKYSCRWRLFNVVAGSCLFNVAARGCLFNAHAGDVVSVQAEHCLTIVTAFCPRATSYDLVGQI